MDGYVRSMVQQQLHFINAEQGYDDTILMVDCMSFVQLKKKSVNSNCRPLISDDLMIDFRADFIPLSSVEVN